MARVVDDRPQPDRLVTLATLAVLCCWEASGLDLALTRAYGNASGFVLREQWWFARVLHDGGRWLAAGALAACLVCAFAGHPGTMARRLRAAWIGVTLLCLAAVPAIKQLSHTSCPWDLQMFGGSAIFVPHWLFGVTDGGPGHCFPSGHAVAAFAFLPLYFQWRATHRRRARCLLAAVLCAGLLFGWAQLARGAHFPSHTLWSAWLCWAISATAARWLEAAADRELRPISAGAARLEPQ